jgi:hypothetical protein
MHSDAHCLKTGCDLVLGPDVFHGDLFEFDKNTYLFNAVVDERGEARRIQVTPAEWSTITIQRNCRVFERRGLFVFSKEGTLMNRWLADYIAGDPQHG